jgi:hypothetical protein
LLVSLEAHDDVVAPDEPKPLRTTNMVVSLLNYAPLF